MEKQQGYRVCYDRLFLPKNKDGFMYKGKRILDLQIYFVFKLIDKISGEEMFFSTDEKEPVDLVINELYKCIVDTEQGYKMILNERTAQINKYDVQYEVGSCYKSFNWSEYPVLIDYDEFMDILKSNIAEFNNIDNKPVQSVSYSFQKVVD